MKERNGLDRRGAWSLGQVKRKEFPDSMGSSIGMGTGDFLEIQQKQAAKGYKYQFLFRVKETPGKGNGAARELEEDVEFMSLYGTEVSPSGHV